MAASLQTDVQDIIECTICLEPMSDSRMLQCQHSFCFSCLKPMALNGIVKCPNCRWYTPLSPEGIDDLPRDFTVNKLAMALSKTLTLDTPIICATCPVSQPGCRKPAWFCNDCQDNLCDECADAHRKMPIFESHDLIKSERCTQHPRRDRSYICTDCQVLICSACIMLEHKDHKVKDAKKYLATCQQDLGTLLQQAKENNSKTLPDIVNKIDIKSLEVTVSRRFNSIKTEIDDSAHRNVSQIKQEQMALQACLAADEKLFASWISSVKESKKLNSEMEELITVCDEYLDTCSTGSVPGQKVLNDFKSISAKLQTANDQIGCNKTELCSFSSLEIPMAFSVPPIDITLGTIHKVSEIQPGIDFRMFSKHPNSSNQQTSKEKQEATGVTSEVRPLQQSTYEEGMDTTKQVINPPQKNQIITKQDTSHTRKAINIPQPGSNASKRRSAFHQRGSHTEQPGSFIRQRSSYQRDRELIQQDNQITQRARHMTNNYRDTTRGRRHSGRGGRHTPQRGWYYARDMDYDSSWACVNWE